MVYELKISPLVQWSVKNTCAMKNTLQLNIYMLAKHPQKDNKIGLQILDEHLPH